MSARDGKPGAPALAFEGVGKTFTLHNQGGIELTVLRDISLGVRPGECLAIRGPSGSGKSTLLRLAYGNYRAQRGSIRIRHNGDWIEMAGADPRTILALRRRTLGYVSQFLRAIPRVPALDVVAEPLIALGIALDEARGHAARLLERLNIPARLWSIAPATFSGGEQQRVNIARVFVVDFPILLLDEPTASLDAANRGEVVALIREALDHGAAILGIFHDQGLHDAVAARVHDLAPIEAAA